MKAKLTKDVGLIKVIGYSFNSGIQVDKKMFLKGSIVSAELNFDKKYDVSTSDGYGAILEKEDLS